MFFISKSNLKMKAVFCNEGKTVEVYRDHLAIKENKKI